MVQNLVTQHFISLLAGLIPIIILHWYVNPIGLYYWLFCIDVIILFYFANRNESFIRHHNYHIITLVFCLAYVACVFAQGAPLNSSILIKIIISSLLAFALLFNKINTIYLKIAHIYVSVFCILNIRDNGYIPFETASINTVSVLVILFASTINYIELYRSGKLSILPSVVSCVACFYSDSRNGAITSLLYFGIILALTWHNTTKYHRFFLLTFSILAIYYVINYITFILNLNIFNRFDYRGLDWNFREILWQGYIRKVDFPSFFFGVDYHNVKEIVLFGESWNPHSSFIQAHNKFGIVGLGLLISMIWLFIKMLKNRKYAILAIVFAVMARSFTDSVFFVNLFDYFVFMIILLFDPNIYKRCVLNKTSKSQ